MAPAVGISFLFPAVPILCAISSVLLLILLPGFWKTGVFALLALVGWLLIGNTLVFIGMVGWHGNIHDAPILADISASIVVNWPSSLSVPCFTVAALWNIWFVGAFGSLLVFSKFVWQRLQPSSARKFYDQVSCTLDVFPFTNIGLSQRRRNNIIDACITILLPLLWVPSCKVLKSDRIPLIEIAI